MTKIREYLVRTADAHDYARDADLEACKRAADELGLGAAVIALDDFLLPIRADHGGELVVYTVGVHEPVEEARVIRCHYPKCDYQPTNMDDLDEHLLSMPTEAPEHAMDRGGLPRRVPGQFVGQGRQV